MTSLLPKSTLRSSSARRPPARASLIRLCWAWLRGLFPTETRSASVLVGAALRSSASLLTICEKPSCRFPKLAPLPPTTSRSKSVVDTWKADQEVANVSVFCLRKSDRSIVCHDGSELHQSTARLQVIRKYSHDSLRLMVKWSWH